jgi:hypothetical protein
MKWSNFTKSCITYLGLYLFGFNEQQLIFSMLLFANFEIKILNDNKK